jgi:hypothetical protein
VVSFTIRPLYPKEKTPGTRWIGGCVSPRAGLEAVVERKIPNSYRDSKPRIRYIIKINSELQSKDYKCDLGFADFTMKQITELKS